MRDLPPEKAQPPDDSEAAVARSQWPLRDVPERSRRGRGCARRELPCDAWRGAGNLRRIGLRQICFLTSVMGLLSRRARITGSVRFEGEEVLGVDDKDLSKIR